jgi:hypothetical protein
MMYKFEKDENTRICMTFIAVLIFMCTILPHREKGSCALLLVRGAMLLLIYKRLMVQQISV